MVASGSFVPVLPIGAFVGGGVPFIVIVLGAVSDDKNVGEEGRERARPGMDATPIRSKGGSEGDQVDFWSIRDGNLEWSLQPAAISVRNGQCRKFGSEQCKEQRGREGGKPINSAR